ncbi:MAG: hypothetical protein FJ303_06640 [Planctomycetes bacterium]|nr:hypothetical protein [Planctomycetota bacterium]
MQFSKVSWLCGIILVLVAGAATALGVALKHEPSFYRQAQTPHNDASKELAMRFLSNFMQMLANRKYHETWGCDASQTEMNCFFHELFDDRAEADDLRRAGISSICVNLEEPPTDDDGNAVPGGHVRLGFRYGSGFFSAVITYELKVWLVPKEPNVIAVEIQRARAGAVPISKQTILTHLSELARKENFNFTQYRHQGNPVAVIDLQGDSHPAKSILTTIRVGANSLSLRGKTLEHGLAPPEIKDAKPLPK